MMEKEIKIGSVIMDADSGRLGVVQKFISNRIVCKMEKSTLEQHKEYFSPVELNWYVLAKMGFKYLNEEENKFVTSIQEGHGVVHDFNLCVVINPSIDVYIESEENEVLLTNVKYAHQLQNLWQSITGQELTFNF